MNISKANILKATEMTPMSASGGSCTLAISTLGLKAFRSDWAQLWQADDKYASAGGGAHAVAQMHHPYVRFCVQGSAAWYACRVSSWGGWTCQTPSEAAPLCNQVWIVNTEDKISFFACANVGFWRPSYSSWVYKDGVRQILHGKIASTKMAMLISNPKNKQVCR